MAKDNLDVLIEESEKALEKGESLGDIEADHHGKEKLKGKSEKLKVEEKIEEEKEAGKEEKSKAKKKKIGKTKVRSKKYQEVKALVDAKEKYEIKEGIELVKKTSMTKFDGNVEVHIRILGKNGKPEQVRGLLQYPHSTGKKISIVILDDRIIDEIEKTKKVEADIYLTTPAMMPKVAKLAKILGPKGKMPNPKAGTITADPEKTMKDMSAGQVEYKTDNTGNIHQVIGKVSGKVEDLEENLKELISVLPTEKIVSANLCATMGPAVKVTIK